MSGWFPTRYPSWFRRMRSALLGVCLAAGLNLASGSAAVGQEAAPATDSAAVPLQTANPSGAFLRGVIFPGWGHTVSGSLGVHRLPVELPGKSDRKISDINCLLNLTDPLR